MKIVVKHRSIHPGTIQKHFADAEIIDVTSKGPSPWIRFSPYFPHGNIPIPFTPDQFGQSVEGIWQGLKVFESEDIDENRFAITKMKGLKRTVRKYGKCLGHRKGVLGKELLSYRDARYQIYLPTYLWILENCLQTEITEIKKIAVEKQIILLDYETNCRVHDLSKPLSHAGLVKAYLEGKWPTS